MNREWEERKAAVWARVWLRGNHINAPYRPGSDYPNQLIRQLWHPTDQYSLIAQALLRLGFGGVSSNIGSAAGDEITEFSRRQI
jgi:hypothetical protein